MKLHTKDPISHASYEKERRQKEEEIDYLIGFRDSIEHLRNKGFSEDFIIEGGYLKIHGEKKQYEPSNFRIKETYRIKINSSTAGQSVIYGIEAVSNKDFRGIVIINYDPESSDIEAMAFEELCSAEVKNNESTK